MIETAAILFTVVTPNYVPIEMRRAQEPLFGRRAEQANIGGEAGHSAEVHLADLIKSGMFLINECFAWQSLHQTILGA